MTINFDGYPDFLWSSWASRTTSSMHPLTSSGLIISLMKWSLGCLNAVWAIMMIDWWVTGLWRVTATISGEIWST